MIASSFNHRLFRQTMKSLPHRFYQQRGLAVKELSWCTPKRSSSRAKEVSAATSVECSSCVTAGNGMENSRADSTTSSSSPSSKFGIIVAMDESRVFGVNNQLPWDIPEDRQYFWDVTKDRILIIGKNCFFETDDYSHLKVFRHVIVVSTTLSKEDINKSGLTNVHLVHSFGEALVHNETLVSSLSTSASDYEGRDDDNGGESFATWIGGGQRLYEEALRHPNSSEIRLTTVHTKTKDEILSATNVPVAFFPAKYRWDNVFKEIKELRRNGSDEKSGLSYTFSVHRRRE